MQRASFFLWFSLVLSLYFLHLWAFDVSSILFSYVDKIFFNFLWEILFINSLFETLFESLKNHQISGRIALQCLLYNSKGFTFLPNRCSNAFSLINTKIGKYVGRTKILYLKEKELFKFIQFQIIGAKKQFP